MNRSPSRRVGMGANFEVVAGSGSDSGTARTTVCSCTLSTLPEVSEAFSSLDTDNSTRVCSFGEQLSGCVSLCGLSLLVACGFDADTSLSVPS